MTHPEPVEKGLVADKRTWRVDKAKNLKDGEGEKGEVKQGWTTMDVLTAYALRNGWVTAKAGRPDVNRAGNALLRMLAEGKIKWGFLPPSNPEHELELHTPVPSNLPSNLPSALGLAPGPTEDQSSGSYEQKDEKLQQKLELELGDGDGIWIPGDVNGMLGVGEHVSEFDGDESDREESADAKSDAESEEEADASLDSVSEEDGEDGEESDEEEDEEEAKGMVTGGRFGALTLDE